MNCEVFISHLPAVQQCLSGIHRLIGTMDQKCCPVPFPLSRSGNTKEGIRPYPLCWGFSWHVGKGPSRVASSCAILPTAPCTGAGGGLEEVCCALTIIHWWFPIASCHPNLCQDRETWRHNLLLTPSLCCAKWKPPTAESLPPYIQRCYPCDILEEHMKNWIRHVMWYIPVQFITGSWWPTIIMCHFPTKPSLWDLMYHSKFLSRLHKDCNKKNVSSLPNMEFSSPDNPSPRPRMGL